MSTTGTFGSASAGGRGISGAPFFGFRFTASATTTITQSRITVNAVVTAENYTAQIYTDSAGSPSATVGSATGSVALNATGNKTFTFGTPPSVTNGTLYWIVFIPAGGAGSTADMTIDSTADDASYQSGRATSAAGISNNLPVSEDWRCEITLVDTAALSSQTMVWM